MKDFEFFVQDGGVKSQAPDANLSDSLVKDSIRRLEYAKSSKLSDETAKYIYENAYESLREAADAILFLKGYKSFSHEATVSFMQRFDELSAKEISEFNRMRVKRNGMKYYGKPCPVDDARDATEFAEKLLRKLVTIQKKLRNNSAEL